MLKIKVNKDVKNDSICLKDILFKTCHMTFSLDNQNKDIFVESLDYLRNSMWYMNGISEIGIFTDVKGISGLVAITTHSITFYFSEVHNQNIICKKDLISIEFTKLKSSLFIDSELITKYSSIINSLLIGNIAYIADNGVIFKYNDKFYTIIF